MLKYLLLAIECRKNVSFHIPALSEYSARQKNKQIVDICHVTNSGILIICKCMSGEKENWTTQLSVGVPGPKKPSTPCCSPTYFFLQTQQKKCFH